MSFAISEYLDVPATIKKLDALVQQPMRPIKRDAMQEYLKYFETRCKRSKELTDEAKKYIPGGVQHNLAFNYPFPLAVKKAEGAYMWDEDDNQYIDFLAAGGPILLGNNYKPVQEKCIEIIKECSPVTGLFHEFELKLAKEVNKHMPSCEMFRMLGTGTESDMAAIRVARTFTGKSKIIKMGGAYHGWSDQLVYGLHVPGTGALEAHGIPRGCNKDTQEFFPNNIDEKNGLKSLLERNEKRGGTAAVLIEPMGPESGTRPIYPDFCKRVRELCDEHDTLLIFDEVVTGFRIGLGGAQAYWGVKPDITVFGKIITGGYPMAGGIGGRREIMELVAAGVEGTKKRAYVGGTLSANPVSCVAGYYSIKEIERTGAHLKAGKAGDRLTKGLQQVVEDRDLPFVCYNQGSLCHIETSGVMLLDIMDPNGIKEVGPRKEMMEEMGAAYMAEGIITIGGSRAYTSMAHTDEIIDSAIERFDRVFSKVEGAK
ncbi:MAG: aspartate aminotransferase family protein [Promethearchaeota archaeon]